MEVGDPELNHHLPQCSTVTGSGFASQVQMIKAVGSQFSLLFYGKYRNAHEMN